MDAKYEADELRRFQSELRAAERNPSKRADSEHFRQQLAADPELIAERIGWLLDGTYGYGAMRAAQRTLASKMNHVAWLTLTVAALEWNVPRRNAMAAWKKLTSSQKRALDKAVRREIRDAPKGS